TAEIVLENAEAIHNQTDGTITLEDDAGNDLAQFIDQGTTGRLAISDSLQVGSLTTAAYSRFGSTAATIGAITASNDVLISGDLEMVGGLYLVGKNIYNPQGTAFLTLCIAGGVACATTSEIQHTLTNGSWVIQNPSGGNVGKAALIVNQQMGTDGTTDIFAASSSGTTRFRVNRNGGTFITGTATTLFTVGGGTGKIDVGTVDPVYNIDGVKYSTYMAGMVGVKEETTGKVTTSEYLPGLGYKTTIDFKSEPDGSDLWLFSRATDLKNNIDKLVVLLSPSDNTRVWYDINKSLYTLSIYSSLPTEISYRLTAPRFDYALWTNYNDNPEATGFEVENEPLTVNGEGEIEEAKAENLADLTLEEVSSPTGSIFENLNLPVYQIKDAAGNIIQEVAKVSDFVVANIKVGALEAEAVAAKSLISFQATIDNLLVTNGLVSPVIETATISPLPDEPNLTVKIGQENIDSGFGKLIVANTQGEEVASIDTEGNASFSGTLEANEVKTNEITAGKIYADEIVARNGLFGQTNTSSVSGITREEIEEMLRKVEQDQQILTQASSWSINTAADSANLEELAVSNLYVTEQAALNALSVSSSLAVGVDMVLQSNSIDSLSAPLSIQSLAMAPVEIMAGKVRIDTDGSVTISGNLTVAGQIESGALKTKELTTDKLIIAAYNPVTADNPQLTTGAIPTNATAGTTTIPAGITQITINNPNISDYTLVYVTPTSSTLNHVLYVKSKGGGFFTVGFSDPLEIDVAFNWWVLDLIE
ncbi:hypothetical protein HYT60_01565, partial [Candidatus Woesebacteria bacterium]|nr:hypothetical protein [Candidatus Woesebacteria bacterium]